MTFKAEVGALSTVFTDVGCNERGTTGGPLGKHGLGRGAPALARIVEGAGSLVQFSPASAKVVGEGSVGLVAAVAALHVPIAVKFSMEIASARRANGVQHAAVVPFSEVEANNGFDLFDDGTANIPSAHGVRCLVHESVNQPGDEELSVEVLGLQRTGFTFHAQNHRFTVLFVEFDHFAQDGVADRRLNDGFRGGDADGAVFHADVSNDRGNDVSVGQSGSLALFVFALLGDDASWGDEARRHDSHSFRKHGPRWVARRSLI